MGKVRITEVAEGRHVFKVYDGRERLLVVSREFPTKALAEKAEREARRAFLPGIRDGAKLDKAWAEGAVKALEFLGIKDQVSQQKWIRKFSPYADEVDNV